MNKVRINREKFSRVVWENIFQNVERHTHTRAALVRDTAINETLRSKADYNTGSVSIDAMWALYAATHFFGARTIAEVGTFIGNSTYALCAGAGDDGVVHTCDATNALVVSKLDFGEIIQYPKTPSTTMFNTLLSKGVSLDLVFLDGRLLPGDIELLQALSHSQTVFALDDFEGIEKGVINASQLLKSSTFNKLYYHLVYPPVDMDCTIALLVPRTLVEWTDQ